MSRTIHVNVLDPASIDRAVREIRDYARFVRRKAMELQERVAYYIARDASAVFNSAAAADLIGEGVVTGHVEVSVQPGEDNTTLVIANGEDAVFMEFGAGVYHNGSVGSAPNPWGSDFGFTIGSYGNGNGRKDIWGYYGDDGKLHLTHGVPASMPMYNATMSVIRDIAEIAREVFNSD